MFSDLYFTFVSNFCNTFYISEIHSILSEIHFIFLINNLLFLIYISYFLKNTWKRCSLFRTLYLLINSPLVHIRARIYDFSSKLLHGKCLKLSNISRTIFPLYGETLSITFVTITQFAAPYHSLPCLFIHNPHSDLIFRYGASSYLFSMKLIILGYD